MTHDVKVNLTRASVIVGVLVGLIVLLSAFVRFGDERYLRRLDYERDIADIRADLRVLRCKVARDCV